MEFILLVDSIKEFPLTLFQLCSKATTKEKCIMSSLTVRRHAIYFMNRGFLDMKRIGNSYIVFGWTNRNSAMKETSE